MMHDFPNQFMGATAIRKPAFFGMFSRQRRIGMHFVRFDEGNPICDNVVRFEFHVDLFTDPPSVSLPRYGYMEVDFKSGCVNFTSPDSDLALRGTLSNDKQRITGSVDIYQFQLFDIAGDFVDSPVELFAEDDDDEDDDYD